MTRIALFALALLAGLAACTPATQAVPEPPPLRGNVETGKAVAERWCASCHRVSPDQRRVAQPRHRAPDFVEIMRRPMRDIAFLRIFLDDVKPPMTIHRLMDEEREHLIAYMLTLRRQAAR
jgi:mono/diheme cytochrome c family protein